eukprot:15448414-Alexandrium_andersonii.AAC.1
MAQSPPHRGSRLQSSAIPRERSGLAQRRGIRAGPPVALAPRDAGRGATRDQGPGRLRPTPAWSPAARLAAVELRDERRRVALAALCL